MRKFFGLGCVILILIGCHAQTVDVNPFHQTTIGYLRKGRIYGQTVPLSLKTNTEPCPEDMVEINGLYCPFEEQECLRWIDHPGARCEVWKNPVKCLSAPIQKHYCIDRYEYPNKRGTVPQDWMSWYDVKNACESASKRLCTRSEWDFAAEGPQWHPYPYGDGFHRDKSICNFDNSIPFMDIQGVKDPKSEDALALRDLLVPSGSLERCVSDWGVHDMAGNIDEWVVNETGKPYVSGLMGGHVFGVRNASRPMTDAHNPEFHWYETGGRCCQDPNE